MKVPVQEPVYPKEQPKRDDSDDAESDELNIDNDAKDISDSPDEESMVAINANGERVTIPSAGLAT